MPDALETERVGDLIVQVMYDENGDATNPRDFDNLTVIYGSHRSYKIGDGEPPSNENYVLERGGIRLLYRCLRRYGDIVAFVRLGMYDHSGVAYYPIEIDPPSSGAHWQDPQGWDSGAVGYAYITRKRWIELMGDWDPNKLVDAKHKWPHGLGNQDGKVAHALNAIESEIEEYSDWANGSVYGYVVTKPCPDAHHEDDSDEQIADCPHSEVLESCWGFIGDTDYALAEGKNVAEYLNKEATPA